VSSYSVCYFAHAQANFEPNYHAPECLHLPSAVPGAGSVQPSMVVQSHPVPGTIQAVYVYTLFLLAHAKRVK